MSFQSAAGANYLQQSTANNYVQSGLDMTITCWIYPTTIGGTFRPVLSTFDGSGAGGWEMGVSTTSSEGTFYFGWQLTDTTYTGYNNVYNVAFPTNEWWHLAVRYRATLRTYDQLINGRIVGEALGGTAMDALSRKLLIKQSKDNPNTTFAGNIAYVRIYHDILTPEEILTQAFMPRLTADYRSRIMADYPLLNEWGVNTVKDVDRGPLELGDVTATGTCNWAFDPLLDSTRKSRLLRSLWPVAAAAAVTPHGYPMLVVRSDIPYHLEV